MAEEDKTYCGRGSRDEDLSAGEIEALAERYGVTADVMRDIVRKVGPDAERIEAQIRISGSAY